MKLQRLVTLVTGSVLATTAVAALTFSGPSVSAATLTGPPQPTSGPGSNTPCNYTQSTTESTTYPGRYITIVYPTGTASTPIMGGTCGDSHRPVVAIVHGLAAGDSILYQGIINHEAAVGNIVIFATYQTDPLDFDSSFAMEQAMIEESVKMLTRDDMSRFGLIGHSMGAGAIPYLVEQAAAQGWGKTSFFAIALAPWEIEDVPAGNFTFPSNLRLIVENFDEDVFVSRSVGVDLYDRANLPDTQKIHIDLNSETRDGVSITATHLTPNEIISPDNNEKYYGIYRNADLLQTCSVDNTFCNFPAMAFMGDWSDGVPFTPATVSNNP